ncbi:type II toxin-antitoxin system Phd/YefM family antitoxin [Enterovirga aerilata]|uniref:type II toxin-antitoxin system Phd/YefM family antitoxin n=1 Tax=Enterovirga aerilata TaxID=2730920 RepID=UPI0015830E28|nr:type II toxin-antitoxin system prevent-host-death family antitoxin [Enterovirga sp. DB1703]
MSQVDIEAAAGDLQGLVARARSGEEVVLIEGGRPMAKLVPIIQHTGEDLPPRQLGLARGRWNVPEDFDTPLPEEVVALFYEGPLFPEDPSPSRKDKP